MNSEAVSFIAGVITVALGLAFFYFPWQTFVVDQTRQRLFEIRDSWFDYSLTLEEEADKAAAAAIRSELNLFIRLTHHVTLPTLLCSVLIRATVAKHVHFENKLAVAISGFKSDKAAKHAKKTIGAALGYLTWGVIRRSLIALAVLPMVALATFLLSSTSNSTRHTVSLMKELIKSEANACHPPQGVQKGRFSAAA